ncbi:MAG: galactose-phosphate uridyl transferase, class [Nitrospirae bacterium]|nr:galactose-phosphate uridyl transferase, class [Nitrospirota bacterium]
MPSESVLVATARSLRPKTEEPPVPYDTRQHVNACPFCRGNEGKTPPPIAVIPEKGDWALRIIENLYPVLGNDRDDPNFAFGLQQTIEGYGRHEVVIDHSSHGIRIHEMSQEHLALLFSIYRSRMEQLYHSDNRLKYVLVFKNFGPAAGASIAHTHSQIIAMPVVPDNVQAEVRNTAAYYQASHQCIFCSLIDEALTFEVTIYDRGSGEIRRKINVGQFVIERSEKFIAIKPFASRYAWEVHILPLLHQADFLAAGTDDFVDLAAIFKRTMARLNAVLGGVQYNFFIHSIPHGAEYEDNAPAFHWHIEICPRTTIPSGFELGSGLFVNTICPEDAAGRLRNVSLDGT